MNNWITIKIALSLTRKKFSSETIIKVFRKVSCKEFSLQSFQEVSQFVSGVDSNPNDDT